MRERPSSGSPARPACGKTTLISSYLEARKLPCLWYQLEAGDADAATFFYFLGQRLKRPPPGSGNPSPFSPRNTSRASGLYPPYFQGLYDRLKIPGIVVFDNYQDVPAGAPLHEIILNGLSALPMA